jgi:hypothetical protein
MLPGTSASQDPHRLVSRLCVHALTVLMTGADLPTSLGPGTLMAREGISLGMCIHGWIGCTLDLSAAVDVAG